MFACAAPASHADSLAREAAVLSRCTVRDFDVLEHKGGGSNGAVFLARCNNRDNPFWAWKVYALKMSYNYGGLTSAGLVSRFQGEYVRFQGLAAARAARAAVGHRDGLVVYHHHFPDEVPEIILGLLPPETQGLLRSTAGGTKALSGSIHTDHF